MKVLHRTLIGLFTSGIVLSGCLLIGWLTAFAATADASPLGSNVAVQSAAPNPPVAPGAPGQLQPKAKAQAKPSLTAAADGALALKAQTARLQTISAVRSWAAQMQNIDIERASASPVDLIVGDATAGGLNGHALSANDVAALKRKPDGSRRLAISYLSIGESEDYRPDYFDSEYMKEDAPDWLLKENSRWKGNRLIRFCEEGWQKTILGDEDGRSVYNSLEASPLYRLIELGFDGVYLDRVDVYSEVQKECPDAARRMVEFVARLAAHARKKNPNFIVILQNAEELLADPKMVQTIDAIAKEDLFYGADHSERENEAGMVASSLANLKFARAAGRPVFVLDYLKEGPHRDADKAKIEAQGFIPYFAPRKLDQLWLPGAQF